MDMALPVREEHASCAGGQQAWSKRETLIDYNELRRCAVCRIGRGISDLHEKTFLNNLIRLINFFYSRKAVKMQRILNYNFSNNERIISLI